MKIIDKISKRKTKIKMFKDSLKGEDLLNISPFHEKVIMEISMLCLQSKR